MFIIINLSISIIGNLISMIILDSIQENVKFKN